MIKNKLKFIVISIFLFLPFITNGQVKEIDPKESQAKALAASRVYTVTDPGNGNMARFFNDSIMFQSNKGDFTKGHRKKLHGYIIYIKDKSYLEEKADFIMDSSDYAVCRIIDPETVNKIKDFLKTEGKIIVTIRNYDFVFGMYIPKISFE